MQSSKTPFEQGITHAPDGPPSTHWDLHFSVTRTHGNRTLPVSSPQWAALRAEILFRDDRTCSACGHVSPHANGRSMVIDHADGDASNNDPTNLRIHCPPCEAVRHCGIAGLRGWLVVGESTMDQVDIVRKTRGMFESTGTVPHPKLVDPSAISSVVGETSPSRLATWRSPGGDQKFLERGGETWRSTPPTQVIFGLSNVLGSQFSV